MTIKEQYYKGMKNIYNVTDDMIEDFYGIMTYREIKAGDYFVRAGDHPKTMAYIVDGTFRLFYVDEEGHDYTKGFSRTGWFSVSYSALLENRESYFSIEAVRDSKILEFSYKGINDLAEKDMRWYPFILRLVDAVYVMKEKREKAFLLDDATTRYEDFLTEYPNLLPELKQYHVASYLGITPETLSRIRKQKENV